MTFNEFEEKLNDSVHSDFQEFDCGLKHFRSDLHMTQQSFMYADVQSDIQEMRDFCGTAIFFIRNKRIIKRMAMEFQLNSDRECDMT
jgi:hypothetical protein